MESGFNLIGTTRALEIVDAYLGKPITLPTLIAWVEKESLGRKIGGQWRINEKKLTDYLEGNKDDKKTQECA